ncbi:TrbC/VirB2 family protein [Edaphobacter bradus]|uniref:TrbC/VirB2 family protein n=1 Tax=Edaphobacter bradus TaxID=2259016 RepID=UPI0021E0C01E|nr:TrbC/VirB2 family protein [Edaphobacter bradus]
MYRINKAASGRYTASRAKRWAQPFTKRQLLQAARALWPMLVTLAFASVAHAQGTMDFSEATTLMGTFKTFAIYAGAVICFGGLIFAGIRMMSGRFQDAIPGLFGALFGAGVLGWGAGWIGSLTGQNM